MPRTAAPQSAAPWLYAAAVLGALGALVVAAAAASRPPLTAVDRSVADRLHAYALAHPAWTETNRALTDWVWGPWTMRLLLLAALLALWVHRHRLLALWCAATSAAGTALQQGLKSLVGRARPHWRHPVDTAHYAAMPSGHAMTAAVTCVLLVWLVHRYGLGGRRARTVTRCAVAAGAVSVPGVCLTRVALGVHWLSDTVAGALLGGAVAAASVGVWNSLTARAR